MLKWRNPKGDDANAGMFQVFFVASDNSDFFVGANTKESCKDRP
jgi:hypothetical protein